MVGKIEFLSYKNYYGCPCLSIHLVGKISMLSCKQCIFLKPKILC